MLRAALAPSAHPPSRPWRWLLVATLLVVALTQLSWVTFTQPVALLPGDHAPLLAWGLLAWSPFLLTTLVPARWGHSLGLVSGLLLVPLAWPAIGRDLDAWWQRALLLLGAGLVGHLLGRVAAAGSALAWLASLSALPSAFPSPPRASEPPDHPPIVLITLDTFRADHVGRIGGARFAALTPHLDALAARGVLFHEGVAPAPVTGPSHVGLLAGAFPADLGVRANGQPVGPDATLVAEELHARGWRTGAFLGSQVLDRRIGLHRGFDHYDDRFSPLHSLRDLPPFRALAMERWWPRDAQRPGARVVDRALSWLGDDPRGTLLWVHLYDAHTPHDPPGSPADELYDRDPGHGDAWWTRHWGAWRRHWLGFGGFPGLRGPRSLERAHLEYAAEVREVDALVGRLVAALPADTSIVVAADHGESLGEHGYPVNHGRHVFQATLRVPLWVVGPGVPSDRDVHHPVPSWLVGEELRRLAGLTPPSSLTGHIDTPWPRPIESFTTGQEARPALMLGPSLPEYAVREGADKQILGAGRHWRVDLATDADERFPEVLPPADAALERLEALSRGPELDEATTSWLESLGYVD